ncbi:MAG TPA: hypothetical protein VGM03_03025 [Phycisphaerae bacterium]
MTRFVTRNRVCCRGCARKAQLVDLTICLLFGWWGFPAGLFLTPAHVILNLMEIFAGPKSGAPSAALARAVRLSLAQSSAAQHSRNCTQCGYNLAGNITGVCPECGLRFASPPSVDVFAQHAARDVRG